MESRGAEGESDPGTGVGDRVESHSRFFSPLLYVKLQSTILSVTSSLERPRYLGRAFVLL